MSITSFSNTVEFLYSILSAIITVRPTLKFLIFFVVNSEKAIISGKKSTIKNRYKEKREVGTYRKGPFYPRMPDMIVKRTIRGMIPYQTPHGRSAFKRLKCYIGVPREFEGKKFESIKKAEKLPADFVTIEELSKSLGAKI